MSGIIEYTPMMDAEMMNSSLLAPFSDCNLTEPSKEIGNVLEFVVYHVFTFIYLIVGLSGNIILLIAFWKQSRKECAYGYQVIFTVSKTLEIFWFGTFLLAYYWLGSSFIGVSWFVQSYFLMYTFKDLGFGIHYALMINSALLAVAMAADRVFAIKSPLVHKNINHTRHQICATFGCLFLGLLGSSCFFYSMQIYWDPIANRYICELNEDRYHSEEGGILFFIGAGTRIAGIIALLILYLMMVIAFRRHIKRTSSLISYTAHGDSRRATEKALLWLNIYHACMMLLNQIPHVIWHFLYYLMPFSYHYCYGRIIGTICDSTVLITDTFDFFIVIAINRRMRALVFDVFPKRWCCKRKRNVSPIHTNPSIKSVR